jgi:hypothetical protein
MPSFGTSGLMSGEGKRGDAAWPQPPRLSSTLPLLLVQKVATEVKPIPTFSKVQDA